MKPCFKAAVTLRLVTRHTAVRCSGPLARLRWLSWIGLYRRVWVPCRDHKLLPSEVSCISFSCLPTRPSIVSKSRKIWKYKIETGDDCGSNKERSRQIGGE